MKKEKQPRSVLEARWKMNFYWRCLLILLFVSRSTASLDADCSNGYFPCDTGNQCVERNKWCDEQPDCDDESDEAYCKKAAWFNPDPNDCEKKPETHILCGSGICTPIAAKCDGYQDCDDGSDEKYCEVTTISFDSNEASGANEIDIDDDEDDDVIEVRKKKDEDDKSSNESAEDDSPESSEELLFPKRDRNPVKDTTTPSQASIFEFGTSPSSIDRSYVTSTKSSAPLPNTTPYPPARRFSNVTRSTAMHPYHKTLGKRPPMFVNIIPSPSQERQLPTLLHRTRHHHLRMGSRFNNYNNGPYAREYSMWDMNLSPFKKYKEANKPFYFAKDYASLHGKENSRYLQSGVNWLLKQRSPDWGENTARALIALALTNNGFLFGNNEYETTKRRFLAQLGADLLQKEAFMLRTHSEEFNINKLARMMNALLAVCENPRDFYGMDLSEVLRTKIRENFSRRHYYVNPFVYLSLCLSNNSLSAQEVQNLMKQMTTKNHANEMEKDMQSLAVQAFTCHVHQSSRLEDPAYRMSLHETLYSAVSDLQQRMFEDGSFGSVYSSALAAQALMSVNASIQWEPRKTIDFLKEHHLKDGSFGDFLATYYVLPVLSGRSLLHLRNIRCDSSEVPRDMTPSEMLEFAGPKQYIHYSLYFGSSLVSSHSLKVLVPQGISLLDMMRVAEYQDENFRFALEEETSNVYSVSGVPNDAEQGLFWHLYVKPESDKDTYTLNVREQYNGDIGKFFPRTDQHVIFWYHPKMNPLFK